MKTYIYKIIIFCSFLFVVGCQDYSYNFDNGYQNGESSPSEITTDTTGFYTIDKSKYDLARIFPGLVDQAEKRIDTVVRFDLNKKTLTASYLGFKAVPKPIMSTGLYAAPGELIQITIPEGVYGLSAQIGSHMDNLSTIIPSRRAPLIYSVHELIPGVNNIRNPFGGYIWLLVKQDMNKMLDIKFKGAVKSPDYILGVTSSVEQWKKNLSDSHVPWLEFRAPHICLSLPKDLVKRAIDAGKLDNVDQLLTRWENIITQDYYKFIGLTVGSTDLKHRAPDFPERAVLDAQLEGQVYTHLGGQPIVAQLDEYWFNEWTNLLTINAGESWGTFRNFGYNYERNKSIWWSTLSNSSPNVYAFKIAGLNNALPTLGSGGVYTQFPLALQYAVRTTPNYFDIDSQASNWIFKLTPFIQLFHKVSNPQTGGDGWGLYPYLLSKLESQQFVATDDMSKRNFFFIGLCEYTQKDYSPFFDAWGIAISDYARTAVSVYPAITNKLWEYDPITKQGGDALFTVAVKRKFYDRTSWALSASSSAPNETFPNGLVQSLTDGDPATFWHSCWSSCSPAVTLPHKIFIDMKQQNTVSGFYMSSRIGSIHPKSVTMFISTDGLTYTSLGTFNLADSNYKQFFNLPQNKTFRYIRFEIPTNNYSNTIHASFSELGTYLNL